jgi:signal transduction histidine kinase/DNA-binding response OmpR family regulator/serine phosphatase RsbU (regulator of sigma subunit)
MTHGSHGESPHRQEDHTPRPPGGAGLDVLRAGGTVGRDLLAVTWDETPLGRPEAWPQSLTTIVQAMLGSRFSMWMAWGPDLTFFCNDAYRRDTLGQKYPWALGRSAREVWSEIWEDIGPRIARVMATGEATWDESLLLFLERSGFREETYHTFSYSPLTDESGRAAGMLCVVSEVTERVVAERRIGVLRSLAEELGTAHAEDEVVGAVERVVAASSASLPFALLYLIDGDQAHLRSAMGIAAEHPAAPVVLALDDDHAVWPAGAAAAGRRSEVDDLPSRFDGLPVGAWDEPPTHALVVPLAHQGGGRPYGFLVAALNRYRPVDDDHRAFIDLLAGQIATGLASARAYEAERERAEQLAELDRAKTAFFTNVSHELRTPLTLLLGPAEDALSDPERALDDVQRGRLEVIDRNAQRLLQLVNTLLDFSRLESGKAVAHFEAVDLGRYTAELASMFESATARAGLTLDIRCPAGGEPVFVDREMWAKIVFNLLSNALKFTLAGTIGVELVHRDGVAALTVADTGIGIAPHEQVKLFERFHRVEDAQGRTHEGSGIGLALVAELARLHGGTATVDSTPGAGSRFHVTVPLGNAHLPPEEVGHGVVSETQVARQAHGYVNEALRWLGDGRDHGPARPEGATSPRPRVLVVDDNVDMREYVAQLLAAQYDVESAPDGQAALARINEHPPDLVLTDVMMPNLDGFGLLRALRADPGTLQIPVVMLSARGGEEGLVDGLEAGADDYLAKPFSARELRARVAANLELDRVRRTRDELARNRELLDQAEALAQIGSWEIELVSQEMRTSPGYRRLLGVAAQDVERGGRDAARRHVHADDVALAREQVDRLADTGAPMDYELRVAVPGKGDRLIRVLGRRVEDEAGVPTHLRGSVQDITEQRAAEHALAQAAAQREAAAREHQIADELQRSLLPSSELVVRGLEVAAYYRAGSVDSRVGGDWYDAIALDDGRTAVVIGDVMGRGVRAAVVMGQLRAAIRAYAGLPLEPSAVMSQLNRVVGALDEEQLVTCVYAVYDPVAQTLTFANAGHPPPLLSAGGGVRRLRGSRSDPPLGSGATAWAEHVVPFGAGATLALYTDGLVERRDEALDAGIDDVATALGAATCALPELPGHLVTATTADALDDDTAILVARPRRDAG